VWRVVLTLGRVVVCVGLRGCRLMRNESAQLTPRGELVADILTILIGLGMAYAILRAFAVVVVKLGQVLGII
jgi:hypothetical protein